MGALRSFRRIKRKVANNNQTQFNCTGCGHQLTATMPPLAVFNDLRSSVAVAAHAKPIRCVCGTYYAITMQTVQASWAVVTIPEQQASALSDSGLILAPANSLSAIQGN